MHKSQLLFILLLSFVLGVALGSFVEVKQTALSLLFVPPLTVVGVFWRKNWRVVFGALVFSMFIFGVLRVADFHPTATYLKPFGDTNFKTTLYGYIDNEPVQQRSFQKFVFRVRRIKAPDYFIPEIVNEKILVVAETYPVRRYGEKLALEGKIKLPKSYEDFDYISYLAKDQIFTLMFKPMATPIDPPLGFGENLRLKVFGRILAFKSWFENRVEAAVVEPHASFLNGILLGSRQNIPPDLKDDFSQVGVTHILAISGYNISIIGTVLFWFLIFFFRRSVAFWFSLLGILIFTILTGASASVARAALMGGLVLLANHSGRIYNSKNALTLAAFLMVWNNPLILRYDIGFQLSFMATMGLLYVAPLLKSFFRKIPNLLNIKDIFFMTLSAQIMVLPLILYYFHNFSVIALLANVVILPFIPLAMLLGFLTGLFGMMGDVLGAAVGALAWLASSVIIQLVQWFARIPGLSWEVFLSWPGIVISYLLIILALLYLKKLSNKTADDYRQ